MSLTPNKIKHDHFKNYFLFTDIVEVHHDEPHSKMFDLSPVSATRPTSATDRKSPHAVSTMAYDSFAKSQNLTVNAYPTKSAASVSYIY